MTLHKHSIKLSRRGFFQRSLKSVTWKNAESGRQMQYLEPISCSVWGSGRVNCQQSCKKAFKSEHEQLVSSIRLLHPPRPWLVPRWNAAHNYRLEHSHEKGPADQRSLSSDITSLVRKKNTEPLLITKWVGLPAHAKTCVRTLRVVGCFFFYSPRNLAAVR